MITPDVLAREDLPFPGSLPEFQRLFPHDAACAAYLEAIRWRHGFMCMWCGERGEPFRFNRRFYPFNAFRSLLGISGSAAAPTYDGLYSGSWQHANCSSHG